MRWPFGPPHLTLKPSKKNQTKKTTQKKIKKEIPKKKRFSYQSKFFYFDGVSKNCPFLTPWPTGQAQKTRTQKHYKNRGFSLFLEKLCVTKRPFLDKKNPNSEIPIIIFCLFFSFKNKKTQKSAETPIFIVF